MIQKVNINGSQVYVKQKKDSSIPADFEPVPRKKQDEEKDPMYSQMGDNSQFVRERMNDDNPDDDSDTIDVVAKEEELEPDDENENTD